MDTCEHELIRKRMALFYGAWGSKLTITSDEMGCLPVSTEDRKDEAKAEEKEYSVSSGRQQYLPLHSGVSPLDGSIGPADSRAVSR